MNAAIFGANGFLGRNLVSEVLRNNFKVWAFYRNARDRIRNGCTEVDVRNIRDIRIVFDYIFIAIGNHGLSPEQFAEQQVVLKSILEHISFRKVVYASSVAVYGRHDGPIRIGSPFVNPTAYGQAKISEESVVTACDEVSLIRFTYLYGRGMGHDSLLPRLCHQAKTKKKIQLFGDGSRRQDYLHVTDATALLLKSALSSQNIVAIGATGKSISNREVALEICQNIPEVQIEFAGSDTTASFIYDIEETKRQLNWAPHVSFAEGLEDYIGNDLAGL